MKLRPSTVAPLLLILTGLAGFALPALAADPEPLLWPEPQRAFLQDGPGLLLTDEQRAELLALDEAGREAFIQAFLDRDPIPETPRNELREGVERRLRLAALELETPLDARVQLLFLRGAPAPRPGARRGGGARPAAARTAPRRPAAAPASPPPPGRADRRPTRGSSSSSCAARRPGARSSTAARSSGRWRSGPTGSPPPRARSSSIRPPSPSRSASGCRWTPKGPSTPITPGCGSTTGRSSTWGRTRSTAGSAPRPNWWTRRPGFAGSARPR